MLNFPVEKSPSLQRLASMSVRVKLVLSAAAIVIMAGLLSFVFTYFKAVAQLNDEIDKKGARMVNVLRGIPPEIWVQFMRMKNRNSYYSELIEILDRYGPEDWKVTAVTEAKVLWDPLEQEARNPDWSKFETYADLRAFEAKLRTLLDGLYLGPGWFDRKSDAEKKQWFEDVGKFQNPYWRCGVLSNFKKDTQNKDVFMISVKPVGIDGLSSIGSYEEGKRVTISLESSGRIFEGLAVADGTVEGVPARRFKFTEAVPSGGEIEFFVLLSLEDIQAAKLSLLVNVILPIFLSIILGVAVAFFVGSLITKPLTRA